jgi:hypothetical protein
MRLRGSASSASANLRPLSVRDSSDQLGQNLFGAVDSNLYVNSNIYVKQELAPIFTFAHDAPFSRSLRHHRRLDALAASRGLDRSAASSRGKRWVHHIEDVDAARLYGLRATS